MTQEHIICLCFELKPLQSHCGHLLKISVTCSRPVTRGKLVPTLEKCVGHRSKLLDMVQKMWKWLRHASPDAIQIKGVSFSFKLRGSHSVRVICVTVSIICQWMVFRFDSRLADFRFFFLYFFQASVLCLGVSVRLGLWLRLGLGFIFYV